MSEEAREPAEDREEAGKLSLVRHSTGPMPKPLSWGLPQSQATVHHSGS